MAVNAPVFRETRNCTEISSGKFLCRISPEAFSVCFDCSNRISLKQPPQAKYLCHWKDFHEIHTVIKKTLFSELLY